jgi:hypothetical protein
MAVDSVSYGSAPYAQIDDSIQQITAPGAYLGRFGTIPSKKHVKLPLRAVYIHGTRVE